MNAKKVKSFRRSLHQLGHDPKHREYVRLTPTRNWGFSPGTIALDPRCGRAMYQAAKAQERQA